MVVVKRSANRVQLESDKYKASVRLTWDEKKKTWLLTMFEKKNSALDNTTDTGKTLSSNGNDTATPESTVVSSVAKLDDIRSEKSSSEGGTSSISHAAEATPAVSLQSRGDDMSDTSEDKGSEISETGKEKTEKVAESKASTVIAEAKEEDVAERNSSYVFVKAFKKADGSRYYYFTSITVSKDGREVVVSNQEKSRNRLLRLMTEGKMLWRTPKDATTASVEQQGLDYAQPSETETATKGSGITPQSTDMSPSAGKGSEISETGKEKTEKVAESKASTVIAEAEQEVNTEPTDAQKEAGNYKKGLEKLKRQAAREDGQLLIQTSSEAAAALSTLPSNSSSAGKVTEDTDTVQEKGIENVPMPVDDKGKKDYRRAGAERTERHIYDELGLSEAAADKVVANNVKAAAEALKKARKAAEKVGDNITDPDEMVIAEGKAREAIEDAEATKAFWEEVQAHRAAAIKAERERVEAEQAERDRIAHEQAERERIAADEAAANKQRAKPKP